jgi:hypothetical protein
VDVTSFIVFFHLTLYTEISPNPYETEKAPVSQYYESQIEFSQNNENNNKTGNTFILKMYR